MGGGFLRGRGVDPALVDVQTGQFLNVAKTCPDSSGRMIFDKSCLATGNCFFVRKSFYVAGVFFEGNFATRKRIERMVLVVLQKRAVFDRGGVFKIVSQATRK